MAAGMKDVASLAGVAVGTVSNVLNHPELVRPQTRARVEAAMEQLGFIPNASARQLRAGRGSCLGLVVLDVRNPFFTEVARGGEDYAQAQGHAVILCNSDEAEDKERRYLRVLEEQRVRGILITPVHGSAPAIKGIRAAARSVPWPQNRKATLDSTTPCAPPMAKTPCTASRGAGRHTSCTRPSGG
jgi:LacI family transcriptional regulator